MNILDTAKKGKWEAGHIDKWAGHTDKWAGHTDEWAGHIDKWAGHIDKWAEQRKLKISGMRRGNSND